MKTLYKRLSKDNKNKLKEFKKTSPTTGGLILDALNENKSWGNLTVSIMMVMFDAIYEFKPFDLDTFINFFENE
jgi:hypothetical protein